MGIAKPINFSTKFNLSKLTVLSFGNDSNVHNYNEYYMFCHKHVSRKIVDKLTNNNIKISECINV